MTMVTANRRMAALMLMVGSATGCAVGPDYHRPSIDIATAYKEDQGWKPTEPSDAINRGPWWEIFKDPDLDQLEAQIDISNQNVRAAAAAVEEAQALVREATAGFWPTIAANFGRQRSFAQPDHTQTVNSAGLTGSWNLDIWGQIRRSTESNKASEQSTAAALAAARLAAQGELATDYFQLRTQDQLQALLNDTVVAQELSLKITESRYKFGVAAKADVVTAQTQLLTSQAQQVNAGVQRALLEHAIAVLIGRQPSAFALSPKSMRGDVPTVPAGLPSALLERRPDIAEAERKVAAANAQIGVARAAFFPALTLTGSNDYSGGSISKLIRATNRTWAFGPSVVETLFAGGLHRAQAAAARAAFEASVDSYRQTVLAGLQQVEDELATLRILEKQSAIEEEVVKAAQEAEALTLNQYKAGTVPYSSVISAQTTTLSSREAALTVLVNRLNASVSLIEALGGGWEASQLQ